MDIEEYKKKIIDLLQNTENKKLNRIDIINYFTNSINDESERKAEEKKISKSLSELNKNKFIKSEGTIKEGTKTYSIKPWSYNKGEWSEIYTFAYLLSNPKMYSADKDLNAIEETYFPILKIIRAEDKNHPIYYNTGDTIQIYQDDQKIKEVERIEFENIAKRLLKYIPKGKSAFEIDGAEEFFNNIYCTKVKAQADQKEDIIIETQDIYTGIKAVRGFSIKSYLGSNPTLINPGVNTNFEYLIEGCTDQIVNKYNSTSGIKEKIKYLVKNCKLIPVKHSISKQFEENLQFIDTLMPDILQLLLLYSYQYNLKLVPDVVDKLKEFNPLKYSNKEIYTYKVKKLLCAWALGLTPERSDWQGIEDANGGYITVKSDGSIVCYHLYDRNEFEDYLYNYTKFEQPSTSKYPYLNIYKDNNQYKIKLCLQIRFKKKKRK